MARDPFEALALPVRKPDFRSCRFPAHMPLSRFVGRSQRRREDNITLPKEMESLVFSHTLEYRLKHLSDRVRMAISETGDISHEKVEIAIDPVAGVSASLTNVIMTDEGILSVSSFLFRWCGLVARAYTRTLCADIAHWTSPASSPKDDRELLLKNPALVRYWFQIFVSFSGTGTHVLGFGLTRITGMARGSLPMRWRCLWQGLLPQK
ncbi:MAG: hypothetical protein OXC66_07880 [Roseovarius sp.]|nr:hypothetical protein [Roseovarius sp.]